MHHLTTQLGRELFTFMPWQGELPAHNTQEILLYKLSLCGDFTPFWSILNEDEQARANRFFFERHRRRFAHARAALRILLGKMQGIAPQEVLFTYNQQGKPALANNPNAIEFNISHSKDTALLALGYGQAMGVDIEYFSSREYLGIAKNLFSASELVSLRDAPTYLTPLVFFSLWAQKEAFIKTSGLGLSYPTEAFSYDWRPLQASDIHDPVFGHIYRMRSFLPEPACAAALCCAPDIQSIRAFELTAPALLKTLSCKK